MKSRILMNGLLVLSLVAAFLISSKTVVAQDTEARVTATLGDSVLTNALIKRLVIDDRLRQKLLVELGAYGRAYPQHLAEMRLLINGTAPSAPARGGSEILIKFKRGTQESVIEQMAIDEGLTFIRAIPQLRLRVYRLRAGLRLTDVIDRCRSHEYVEYVERNQVYGTQR